MKNLLVLVYLIFLVFAWESFAKIKFGFGSCHDQNKKGNHFKHIANEDLDAWIWLGDNIYADHFNDERRRQAYLKVSNDSDYRKIKEKMEVLGTWDDHDYAFNNTGASYAHKKESKALFIDFIGFNRLHPINFREGIFYKKVVEKDGVRVKFLLLDLRYFNAKPELLGESQWMWLEQSLKQDDSDITFIISSLNVLGERSLFTFFLEGWHQFPSEQERLFRLVNDQSNPVIFLSGDRHYSERAVRVIGGDKVVFEFMSSGLNKPGRPLPNRFRVGDAISVENFATIEIYMEKTSNRLKILHHIKSSHNGSVISSLETFIH